MSSIVDTPYSTLSQPKSGWQLFKSLASGTLTPGLAWQNPAYRRKFMLRSLATPLTTSRLLANLAKQPRLMQILEVQPGLPCRLHRPWLTVNMGRQHTLEALNYHYQMMSRHLPAPLLNGYLSGEGITLVTLTGKDEQQFSVCLRADAFLDKEGEATLTFVDCQNTVLAELTFTLCNYEGKPSLFIGGMQGAKAHVPHEQIQLATKACHGLFPKRLLVEAVMILADAFPVEQILAVSNATHIYRSWRYRRKKRGNCWRITTASGALLAENGWITATLPCLWPCRASRWKRLRVKSAPNTAVAMRCLIALSSRFHGRPAVNRPSRAPARGRGRTFYAAAWARIPRLAFPLPSPPLWLNPVLTTGGSLWRSPGACSLAHPTGSSPRDEKRRQSPGGT